MGYMKTVAVLFARADSHYKALPGSDVWDAERDALRWPGGCPVVARRCTAPTVKTSRPYEQ